MPKLRRHNYLRRTMSCCKKAKKIAQNDFDGRRTCIARAQTSILAKQTNLRQARLPLLAVFVVFAVFGTFAVFARPLAQHGIDKKHNNVL